MPENAAEVGKDSRRMIHDICNIVGLSYGTCQPIMSDKLDTRRIAAKIVLMLLADNQKHHRLESAWSFRSRSHDSNVVVKIVPGDESLIYGYDHETKQQSSQRKCPSSPQPKKVR
jgi:hypothetical protein